MAKIAATLPDYSGISYQAMAEVTEQWPIVGRGDLYYGGTTYDNNQGIGVQLSVASQRGERTSPIGKVVPAETEAAYGREGLLLVPFTRLYDQGSLMLPSKLLEKRLVEPALWLHPETALKLGLAEGQAVSLALNGSKYTVPVTLDETLPKDVGLVPRSAGLPVWGPVIVNASEAVAKKE